MTVHAPASARPANSVSHPNRATDEMHLAWLSLGDSGMSHALIAGCYGVSSTEVDSTLRSIRSEYAASEAA